MSDELDPEFKDLYRRTADFHKQLIQELEGLMSTAIKCTSLEDLANIRFITWHLERLGNDIKKKINKLDQLVIKATAMRWINSSLNGEPIRTEYATFSPSITGVPRLPNRKEEPEKYNDCLRAMGVPDEAINTESVTIHWPALKDYIESLAEAGKPLPEAFSDLEEGMLAYSCRVSHKKLEVLE